MPSFDDRLPGKPDSAPIPIPGSGQSALSLLPAENKSTTPLLVPRKDDLSGPETEETTIPAIQPLSFSHNGMHLMTPEQGSTGTRVLTRALQDTVEPSTKRIPVVIKGQRKQMQAAPLPRIPHHRRRMYVTLAGIFSLLLITSFALLTVSPLGHDLSQNFNPSQIGGASMVNNQNNQNSLVAQATATAVYHQQTDGFDASSGGAQTVTGGGSSLAWPLGQCTYWANYEYHQLSGAWVSWSGNADQWVAGAQAAGWHVSTTPHVPSIIVLMAGVQGASAYGHVAVVQQQINSTTVETSNMNWWANGGGWDIVSYFNFTVGPGVYFISR